LILVYGGFHVSHELRIYRNFISHCDENRVLGRIFGTKREEIIPEDGGNCIL
jgi:hypothetical protein